nr:hypothetical protein [Rhizobium leguminosarum]
MIGPKLLIEPSDLASLMREVRGSHELLLKTAVLSDSHRHMTEIELRSALSTREETIMNVISKTLNDMTLVERSSLLDTVADALEATAEEAEGEGDTRFVANSICVANTIRGLSGDMTPRDLQAAELLLEQGIMLVHQFSNRAKTNGVIH